MEGFFDVDSVSAICGGDAKGVSCAEGRCRDVKRCCLCVGPNSCSFTPVDILYDFVLDVAENVVAFFVLLLADICSDLD